MSIATVVTGGFGTFGSVNYLPTTGFSIGLVTVPTIEGLEYTLPSNRAHYALPDNVTKYTMPQNRLNYDFEDEDL